METTRKGVYSLALILITAVAAFLRFHALGVRGLWLDEVISVLISRKSLPQLFQALQGNEINMGLYYVLLHFWMKMGTSESFLRLMSVVCSVAAIPFIYGIGSRLFGRPAGLIAAWFLAVNAFHIRYAQEARAYALFALLATISTYLLVRSIQEPRTGFWTTYGVFLALMLYSHLLGVLIILAHCISILCLPPREIPWKNLARSGMWLVGLTIPLAVIVPFVKADPLSWVPKLDGALLHASLILAAGNRGTLLFVLEAIGVALFLFCIVRALIRNGQSKENWGALLILFWFALPFVIVVTISVFHPFFVPRFLLPSLPAFLLAAGVGLAHIRPRSVGWTLGSAISVLCLAGISPCYHMAGILDDWRAISSHISNESLPGDRISFAPEYIFVPFEYYRLQAMSQTETPKRLWVVFYAPAGLTLETRKKLAAHLYSWQIKGWRLLEPREFANVSVMLFTPTRADAVPPDKLPAFPE
jgi:mannosyltransferase